MNYKKEYERIKKNIDNYSKEEFDEILVECGIERYQKEEKENQKEKKSAAPTKTFE